MVKRVGLFLVLLVTALAACAGNVDFRTEAPSTVVAGEQFRISFSVNQNGSGFRAPDMSEFSVLSGPMQSHSSSMQIINGAVTSNTSIKYTYVLMASNTGTFKLGGASITVDGTKYTSNAVTIKVLPADDASKAAAAAAASSRQGGQSAASGSDKNNIFIVQTISKSTVYEQEAFVVTYKLYTRYDITDIGNIKFPEFKGFYSQDVPLDPNRQLVPEHYNGLNYGAVVLKQSVMFPQSSGSFNVEPGSIDVMVLQQGGVQYDIFGGYYPSVQKVQKTLKIPALKVNVLPLPSGAPASFSGAVGQFDVKSSISSENINANEAVTIKIDINGSGNIKLIKIPELTFPADFDLYDPKTSDNVKVSAAGMTGNKSIEYLVVPRFGGDFSLKGSEFSWFDPKQKKYVTRQLSDYNLHVDGSTQGSAPVIAGGGGVSKEAVKDIDTDIRHIHFDKELKSKQSGFFMTGGFLFGYLIPLLLFIILLVLLRKQARENANVALRKTKRANRVAVKRLKNAAAFMKKGDETHFYEETMKAMWGYLSDKLSIPQSDLTKDNVREKLSVRGVSGETADEFLNTLQDCEFARFSSASDENLSMKAIYGRTTKLIEDLEDAL